LRAAQAAKRARPSVERRVYVSGEPPVQVNELKERIAAFPTWQYEFEFDGGVKTPVGDRKKITRSEQRRGYFFDALLSVTGGSLKGRRVLDLGCSAGYWSLQAIDAGADFVLGVDGREDYIEQAKLVFEAKGIPQERYRFERGNIFEHALQERFDVVLCLGLLSVVAKPVALFELMSGVDPAIIVIDTGLSPVPLRSGFFEVSRLLEPRNAIDYDMVLVPTRQAVVNLAGQFGFETVPLAQNITDYTGMEDYRSQRRLAFICSKGVSVTGLAAEPPPAERWTALLGRALRRNLGRIRG
jgi:2-polyprenyl-3-methyl-5-hydroxy-6-metoxy-1,4-benzoquinol methylase